MQITFFSAFMVILLFITGLGACKNAPNQVTVRVVGDTSYVSAPAIIVGGTSWEKSSKASELVGDGFKYEHELLDVFFPKDSAIIVMVKTSYFSLEGINKVLSFDNEGHYLYLANKNGVVKPIKSVKEEYNEIAAALGLEPIHIDQTHAQPKDQSTMTEQEQMHNKKKGQMEQSKKEMDSVSKSGPQLVNPAGN